jgi:hypothetical protein
MIVLTKNVKYTCVFVLILALTSSQTGEIKTNELDLLNLSKFWYGYGSSVLFPGMMKVLARKLKTQKGMMSSSSTLPGGVNWEMESVFSMQCKENFDTSVGYFLSLNNSNMAVEEYDSDDKSGLFGFPRALDGLMILFKDNTLRVGIFKKPHIENYEIDARTKVCKEYFDKEKKIRLKVKYTDGSILGIYTVDEKNAEKLCLQIPEITGFQNFYLSVVGMDSGNGCSADVNKMLFRTHEPVQIVSENEKEKGDPFFAYFKESEIRNHVLRFESKNKFFEYKREMSKLLAKELMVFADFSQADFMNKMKNDVLQQIELLGRSLEIIEKEARAMQLMGDMVTFFKKGERTDMRDMLTELVDYLTMNDESYDKVDKSTAHIFSLIQSIQIPSTFDKFAEKTQNIIDKLENVISKNKSLVESNLNMKNEKIEKVKKFLDKLYTVEKKNGKLNRNNKKEIMNSASQKISYLKQIGIAILGAIGFSILIGFLIMYLKIKKAIRHKQIL